jgi:hypothetical protein
MIMTGEKWDDDEICYEIATLHEKAASMCVPDKARVEM